MSKFQIILTAIFALFIITGVILFATFKNKPDPTSAEIVVWGTIPATSFNQFINEYSVTLPNPLHVTYVEKKENNFDDDYVQALARGQGPDAILVPQDLIIKESDKIIPIPFSVIPERNFKDTFIQEGEMFITPNGVEAVPFSIDPLVMYWNRDIFANQGLSTYPRTWSDFPTLVSRITVKDGAANITRSAVALGEYQNVTNAKDILAGLFLQAGDSIVSLNDGRVTATLGQTDGGRTSPAESALVFYTNFANPSSPQYSWNRSLPNSKNSFISADLATYFGFSSEVADIRTKNPNLNFDVAPFPQIQNAQNYTTYGKMSAFAIAKSTKDSTATFNIINSLVSAPAINQWSKISLLPPVRRDLLTVAPTDPFQAIAYNSALVARAWIDPDEAQTDTIFQQAIEAVTTGRSSPTEALTTARNQLQNLFAQ